VDNCPDVYNPDQADSDGDGEGDACEFVCGDVNSDDRVNVLDAVFLVSYIFKGGPQPPILQAADCNGPDGKVNIADAVYIINYLFKVGPPPTCW